MLAEIDSMLKPVGFDVVIVCCSNQAAENFWCAAGPMLLLKAKLVWRL